MAWFSFSLVFIMVLGFVSNQNPTAISSVQAQFDRVNCPMPSSGGLWKASNGTLISTGGTYNYPNVNNQTKTLTCTNVHTANAVDYYYGQPTVAIGVFYFLNDFLSEMGDKIIAFGTLSALYLTPINFNIMGYTIASLPSMAVMAVVTVYGFCYIGIGVGAYKLLSPFAGNA